MFEMAHNSIYFIMGSNNTNRDPIHVLEEAIHARIDYFQYREKGKNALPKIQRYELAKKMQALCIANKVSFIVNDDIELAVELKSDGVHLGQNDLSIGQARASLHEECFIGISTSNVEEAIEAQRQGADYIGVGPIYATNTKEDAKKTIGLTTLYKIKSAVQIPVVGIGGIGVDQAKEVFRSGADAVAVISTLTLSKDLKSTVEIMKSSEIKR